MRANPKLELIQGGLGEEGSSVGTLSGLEKQPDEILRAVELGITDREWADICAVSDRWVRFWKSGVRQVSKKHLYKIALRAMEGVKSSEKRLHDIRVWALSIINSYHLDELKGDL